MFRLSTVRDDLSRFRQQFIEELNAKIHLLDLDITIVFDAQYQPGESSRSHYKNLEILFTDEGETADDRILEEIKGEKYQASRVTVVTSDKKLAWYARRCSAKTESAEDFIAWLNKRFKNRLRQRKADAISPSATKNFPPPKKTAVKKPSKPSKSATPEQCADYYLEAFEKEFSKMEETAVHVKKVKAAGKGKTRKPRKKVDPFAEETQQDNALLDMERWLHIFEGKFNQDS